MHGQSSLFHQPLLISCRKQHPARGKHHLAWVRPRAVCWVLLAFLDVFKSGLVKQTKKILTPQGAEQLPRSLFAWISVFLL